MFTSRSESRLLLRIDTADRRLTEIGSSLGLVTKSHLAHFQARRSRIEAIRHTIEATKVRSASESADVLGRFGISLLETTHLVNILRRPEASVELLRAILPASVCDPCSDEEIGVPLNDIKYSGYVENQRALATRVNSLRSRAIPLSFDFRTVSGLSAELIEKLSRVRPETIGQAEHVAGMTPAALNILAVSIELFARRAVNE
jgi:tRNA uridine 5-carboxymethylaminomethyl modification enzyme